MVTNNDQTETTTKVEDSAKVEEPSKVEETTEESFAVDEATEGTANVKLEEDASAEKPQKTEEPAKKKRFMPKTPVQLDPEKSDPISLDYLSKCDGQNEGYPTLVAIKGKVYDVSKNSSYGPGKSYNVFAGKDASRALALSSLKPEDCVPEWQDLNAEKKDVLDGWKQFFENRYNIVGVVEGATNTEDVAPSIAEPVRTLENL